VTLKVRYADFKTVTRSDTRPATRDVDAIVDRAIALVSRTDADRRPVRLLGVSVHNLVTPEDDASTMEAPSLPFPAGASVSAADIAGERADE
jgi:DNA polymerase-4